MRAGRIADSCASPIAPFVVRNSAGARLLLALAGEAICFQVLLIFVSTVSYFFNPIRIPMPRDAAWRGLKLVLEGGNLFVT